jgi:hypothetical protein
MVVNGRATFLLKSARLSQKQDKNQGGFMQLQTAYDMEAGKIRPEIGENCTMPEAIQLAMGVCLTDEGDVICLKCGRPNECCHCGEYETEE